MSEPIIRVENLGKKYLIRHQQQEPYTALRDVITNGVKSLGRILVNGTGEKLENPSREEFWALKDVSFEINRGDRVGIIGRNGAGKSTLLKILSRITEPTTGRINIKGRVASLLEVGTGFHPELTGRENIYLNGAILGMGKVEIKKNFDEIVAFAEVEKFLDTPVKRYSSGMYVRLAFAVAAHLEPEILLVDEVLSVGDLAFQEKCLGKMEDVTSSGKTVVFISHNMESIKRLCSVGVYLNSGLINKIGDIESVSRLYINDNEVNDMKNNDSSIITIANNNVIDNDYFFVISVEILELDGNPKEKVFTWDKVIFRIKFHSPVNLNNGSVIFQLSTLAGTVISLCSTQPDQSKIVNFKKGINQVDCVFEKLLLSSGKYVIGVGLAIPNAEWLFRKFDAGVLYVYPKDVFQSGLAPESSRYLIPQECSWRVDNYISS
ncbi:ABC transporter ATP-binding protein [Roseofilum sp. BLCC_M91]|uniref:ABC transporter ATP-binding protein n=1 Tax=Roseofilum halophilum BLCC-M91 TaxID=3022259 RepID=A0ABT7BLN5_9CYAN|nr:ABC transporter ATP-binding protein [Roseofilum halophilum]MDJ1179449.1 ABC transporter ATP-binding protein [Roseofilum halophilum BLCC-M91]